MSLYEWIQLMTFFFFFSRFRLMLDPYAKIVYDYLGGVEDIRKAKVCMYFKEVLID